MYLSVNWIALVGRCRLPGVWLVSVGVTAWLLKLLDAPLPVIQFTLFYREAPSPGDADSPHPILFPVYGVLPQADCSQTSVLSY